ncbi:MAG: hypothetical protein AAGH60_05510 [Pseudomonadota bacterium]
MIPEKLHWVRAITLEGNRVTADKIVVRRDSVIGARIEPRGYRPLFVVALICLWAAASVSVALFSQTLRFFEPNYLFFGLSLVPVVIAVIFIVALRPRQHLSVLLSDGTTLAMPSTDTAFLNLCLEAFERLWASELSSDHAIYIHAGHRSVDFRSAPTVAKSAGVDKSRARATGSTRQVPAAPLEATSPPPAPAAAGVRLDTGMYPLPEREPDRPMLPLIDLPVFSDEDAAGIASNVPTVSTETAPRGALSERAISADTHAAQPTRGQAPASGLPAVSTGEADREKGVSFSTNGQENSARTAEALAVATLQEIFGGETSDSVVEPSRSDRETLDGDGSVPEEPDTKSRDSVSTRKVSAVDDPQSGNKDLRPSPPKSADSTPVSKEPDREEIAQALTEEAIAEEVVEHHGLAPIRAEAFDTVRSNVTTLARLLKTRSSSPALADAVETLEKLTIEGCTTEREVRALARSISILRGRMTVYPAAIQVLDAVEVAGGLEALSDMTASDTAA